MWVKKRYDIGPWIDGYDQANRPIPKLINGKKAFIGRNRTRPYVPAMIQDNPFLDQSEYIQSLSDLDPVTREQLLGGDWSVSADGRIKSRWARYYSINPGGYIVLGPQRRGRAVAIGDCFRFAIMDPAASAKEGPGDETNIQGSAPSWNVLGTFLLTPCNNLIVWDWLRFREEIDVILRSLKNTWKRHRPSFIGMEWSAMSIHLFQSCERIGLPMKKFKPKSQDKLSRATDFINRMERGRVWFPDHHTRWLEDLESELYTWTAHPKEQDDQVDVMGYAGIYVSAHAAYAKGEENIHQNDPRFLDDLVPDVF